MIYENITLTGYSEAATGGVYKKCVLRNFAKFIEKHLCQSLFFNKVADLRLATLSERRLCHVFSSEFCEISKNTFYTEHLQTTASVYLNLQLENKN